MARREQFGCTKCGNVVAVEIDAWATNVRVEVKEASLVDRSGRTEIECKKCANCVATVSITKL